MKILRFYLNKNKILSVDVKDMSCNSLEGLQLYSKDTPTWQLSYKKSKNIELPQGHLTFLQNLLNVIITKYLKQEIDDNLSVCMDECSPCGLSNWKYTNLSMSHDQKLTLLPGFYVSTFLQPVNGCKNSTLN